MEYKIFINKLYIKGAWLIKGEFTRRLFMKSVYNSSVITDKRNSDSVYKGYNRGNPIDEIAHDIISTSDNLNKSGVQTFIEEYLNNKPDKKLEYSQKICDNFKEFIPDITSDNICKKIADFFIYEVLKPASVNYEKNNCKSNDITTKNNLCDSSGYELHDINEVTAQVTKEENNNPSVEDNSNIYENDIMLIDDELSQIPNSSLLRINDCIIDMITLINHLFRTGKLLANEVNRNPISIPYSKCSNWEPFQKFYNQYQEKNITLHTYFEKYNCNIFTPAINFKNKFIADSFWRCNPVRYTRQLDSRDKIEEYKGILLEISKELEKLLN